MNTDILEDVADEEMLRGRVAQEFSRKSAAEKSWFEVTVGDKLDAALQKLNEKGVIAIHNAGWDKSEGFHRCLDAYRENGKHFYQ